MVLDTPEVVAFLDTRPVFKGHTLVVTRRHVPTLAEVPDDLLVPLYATVRLLSRAVVDALGCQGSFVATNNVVSQSVPHLHVHVVPRSRGDGLRGFFWPRTTYADGEAPSYARRLADAVAGIQRGA
jgi:histidine triad (HIT) family protein